MICFRGCFSVRVSTCLFIFTLCGRIIGALNEPVKVTVMEEDDAILPCSLSTKENIEFELFDWKKDGRSVFNYNSGFHSNNGHPGQDEQFKGRVSHFRDELKHGIASIKIQSTKVADSGDYTCAFPELQPEPQTFHIELVVVEKIIQGAPTRWIAFGILLLLLVLVVGGGLYVKSAYEITPKKSRQQRENDYDIPHV